VTEDVRSPERQLDRALRDLAELNDQVGAHELTDAEAQPLRRRYERDAADAVAALAELAAFPRAETGPLVHAAPRSHIAQAVDPAEAADLDELETAAPAGQADRLALPEAPRRVARGPRPRRATGVLYAVAVAAAVIAAVGLLPAFLADRPRGGFATGNEATATSTTAPAPSFGGRDLSKVTDTEMEAVVVANPDLLGMRLALADRYTEKGQYEKAVTHYLAVLKRDPGNAEGQAHLGWVMFQTGRPEQALALLDRALQREPAMLHALWFRANILLAGASDNAGALDALHRMQREQLTPDVRAQVAGLIAVAQRKQQPGG